MQQEIYIDAENINLLKKSLCLITRKTEKELFNELSTFEKVDTEKDFIIAFYKKNKKELKNCKYKGIYLFHLTRCTEPIKNSIIEKGLIKPTRSIKIIIKDMAKILNCTIKDIQTQKTNLINEDDNIYAMSVNILDTLFYERDIQKEYGFLDIKQGSEKINDIIMNLEDKRNYMKYTKPYVIKLMVQIEDMEKINDSVKQLNEFYISKKDYYLIKYLYILYKIFKNEKIRYDAYICNKNKVVKIIEGIDGNE